jgi:hypothetical protein
MSIAKRTFSISNEHGTRMYREGEAVPEGIAKLFPQHIVGSQEAKQAQHNPNLPQKLSKAAAGKLSEDELMQWIRQFRPGNMPDPQPSKAELVDLVMQLQG